MNYKVKNVERRATIIGLADEFGDANTMLLYHYDSGDVGNPNTKNQMHSALYDELQTNDILHNGDTFETKFGNFICEGVHVVEFHGIIETTPIRGVKKASVLAFALIALIAFANQSCQRVPAAAQTKTVTFEAAASPKAVFYCAGKTKQSERCKKHQNHECGITGREAK